MSRFAVSVRVWDSETNEEFSSRLPFADASEVEEMLDDAWAWTEQRPPSKDAEPTEAQLQRMAEPREPPRGHDWPSWDERWTR